MFVKFLLSSVKIEKLIKDKNTSNMMSIVYIYNEQNNPSLLKHFEYNDLFRNPEDNHHLKEKIPEDIYNINFVQPYKILLQLKENSIEYLTTDIKSDDDALDILIKKEKEAMKQYFENQKKHEIFVAKNAFMYSTRKINKRKKLELL